MICLHCRQPMPNKIMTHTPTCGCVSCEMAEAILNKCTSGRNHQWIHEDSELSNAPSDADVEFMDRHFVITETYIDGDGIKRRVRRQ